MICILASSSLGITISKEQHTALVQPYIQTIKHQNLVIDLGKGVKTNAQLTILAVGEGPFPGVVIFQGAGAGSVIPSTSPYTQMLNTSQRMALLYLDMTREVSGRAYYNR
jgi:hypothetical protein